MEWSVCSNPQVAPSLNKINDSRQGTEVDKWRAGERQGGSWNEAEEGTIISSIKISSESLVGGCYLKIGKARSLLSPHCLVILYQTYFVA